jgi:hypothetical protein
VYREANPHGPPDRTRFAINSLYAGAATYFLAGFVVAMFFLIPNGNSGAIERAQIAVISLAVALVISLGMASLVVARALR